MSIFRVEDILTYVFNFLDIESYIICTNVCRSWKNILRNHSTIDTILRSYTYDYIMNKRTNNICIRAYKLVLTKYIKRIQNEIDYDFFKELSEKYENESKELNTKLCMIITYIVFNTIVENTNKYFPTLDYELGISNSRFDIDPDIERCINSDYLNTTIDMLINSYKNTIKNLNNYPNTGFTLYNNMDTVKVCVRLCKEYAHVLNNDVICILINLERVIELMIEKRL